jgi:hypothetical protein
MIIICAKDFLYTYFGKLHCDLFDFLIDGTIKADFWRICILYIYGGIYTDVDNVPLIQISQFVEKNVDLVTCTSYIHYNFNPNFIICNKNNALLKKMYYVVFFPINYSKQEGIYICDNYKIQIIKECPGDNHYDACLPTHNVYGGKRVFNNRMECWDFKKHEFKKLIYKTI